MDVVTILSRWGRSRSVRDASHLDYPHEAAFNRMARSRQGGWALGAPPLEDEVHGLVDRVVSELKTSNRERHLVLLLCYVVGLSDSAMGRALGCGRSAARELRIAATCWVEGRLAEAGVVD